MHLYIFANLSNINEYWKYFYKYYANQLRLIKQKINYENLIKIKI